MMCQFHHSIHGAELKRRKEGAVMMCQCHHNIHGEELKKETIRCSNDVSIPSQYPWKRAEKEEKKVQPNLCAIYAKHATIIPRDIQLAHNICGKDLIAHPEPKMNYWA